MSKELLKKITTSLSWDDLVLQYETLKQINDILTWLKINPLIHSSFNSGIKINQGYRVLFYGPPGTGKKLTASLIGKMADKEVYTVDLFAIVSKYIGETEKNLAEILYKAQKENWILFFDEADALFGKRTEVRDAHDKNTNQEIAYLLQRVEEYEGLLIFATNIKNNIDNAFIRRFQSIIHFHPPGPEERLVLWQKAFNSKDTLAKEVNMKAIADKYEITGKEIQEIAKRCKSQIKGIGKINNYHITKGIEVVYKLSGRKIPVR